MSEKFIPDHVDPFRYAEQNAQLVGIANINEMERLKASLTPGSANVAVDIKFGIDEQRITYLKGHLDAHLTLTCQRCMEPYLYEIITDFLLGLVNTLDETNELPAYYEPALAIEGQLAVRDLIEDEIILNLPIIPRHNPEDCKVKLPLVEAGGKSGILNNPFDVLKTLKGEKEK